MENRNNQMSKTVIRSQVERAINSNSSIEISYTKYDGTSSRRKISNIKYNNQYYDIGYANDHIEGYCHMRQEDRVFKIDRITRIVLRRR